MSDFKKDIKLRDWKELWSDGFELLLIRFPDFIAEKKIYEIKDRRESDLTIGRKALSPNSTKIAFTVGNFGKPPINDNLYIIDTNSLAIKKIGYSQSDLIGVNGFMGNDRLLLNGNMHVDQDGMLIHEETKDKSSYLSVFNFNTKKLKILRDLGISTVGMANSKCAGDLLAYDTGDGFVVYNVNTKNTTKINKKGDLVSISPDGQKILFKDVDDYYLVDQNGQNQELILTKKEIDKFIPLDIKLRGGYWEVQFSSWSPEGRYILFNESSDRNKGKKYILDVENKELERVKGVTPIF